MQCYKDFEYFRRRCVKSRTLHLLFSTNLMQRAGSAGPASVSGKDSVGSGDERMLDEG